jgi:hypothetical protein
VVHPAAVQSPQGCLITWTYALCCTQERPQIDNRAEVRVLGRLLLHQAPAK